MLKRRGRSGAHSTPPPEWREQYTGATARVWLVKRTEEASQVSPLSPLSVRVHDRHMQKAGCGREQLP